MPVITFANTKGGAGKTTAAVIIASELARLGHRVTLLDADPQQWTSRWYGLTKAQKNLSVISDVSDETIEGHIKGSKKRGGYVIVDLPGGRSPLMAKAIGFANHVLIPVQGCAMDAVGGAEVLGLLKDLADRCDIHIPHSVILTRISPIITTRSMQAVKSLLAEKMVHVVGTPLVERAAYRDMFVTGGAPHMMDPERVSNLDKACENAQALALDVLSLVPAKTAAAKSAKAASAKAVATKPAKKAA